MRRMLMLVAIAGLLAAALLVGCTENADPATITVIMRNTSQKPASLWLGHGDPDAQALVAPGGMRGVSVTVKRFLTGSRLFISDKLRANAKTSDGAATDSTIAFERDYHDGFQYYITWDGKSFSGALTP